MKMSSERGHFAHGDRAQWMDELQSRSRRCGEDKMSLFSAGNQTSILLSSNPSLADNNEWVIRPLQILIFKYVAETQRILKRMTTVISLT
jgi:hypothetical protein